MPERHGGGPRWVQGFRPTPARYLRPGRYDREPPPAARRRSMLCAMSPETWELPLKAPSSPARRGRTTSAISTPRSYWPCRRAADEGAHRDELLFQVVHQVVGAPAQARVERYGSGGGTSKRNKSVALRLLRRASMCMRFITGQLDMLGADVSRWEYQEIRKVKGQKELRLAGRQGAATGDGAAEALQITAHSECRVSPCSSCTSTAVSTSSGTSSPRR